MTSIPWRTIFSSGPAKVALAVVAGMMLPVLTTATSDLVWLHDHRTTAGPLVTQYQIERPLIQEQLKLLREGQLELVVSLKELTAEIHKEREERLSERRYR